MISRVYLSPHLDDAVLSSGGRIHRQAAEGDDIIILTVCAGGPSVEDLSPFAESLHRRWGTAVSAGERRREEDREAVAALGARAMHLEFQDAIYRTGEEGVPLYASEEAIFGPVHPSEFELIEQVAQAVRGAIPADAGVIVPLAAGGHVDHRLTRKAAERLLRRLSYYEDFPYAASYGEVEYALAGADWEAETIAISEADIQARIDAIALYRSQISTFWADMEEMRTALREFALKTGGHGTLAERYWRMR